MNKLFISTSVEETTDLGRRLGKVLKPGDVVALDGDLGAGKTVITRGITEGLGLMSEDVCSPTFTIVNEYTDPADKIPVFHFDTYRLSGEDDFLAAGLDEYFYRDGVCVIEWSSVIEGLLPENTVRITIKGTGDKREITIDDPEERL
jgi:tRNA threonylcarbamoyladenosine biosynthesis protein TsaE